VFKGTSIASVSVFAAFLALTACGSKQTAPAESPESAGSEAKTSEPAAETPPAEAKAEAPKEPEGPSLLRSVVETISEPGNGWVFNFQSSAMYEEAEKKCEASAKGNPKQRANCLSKARSSFIADAMEFKKNDSGQDVWVIYKTKGSRLIKVYSVPVTYGEEKAGVVKMKKAGKATGSAPLFASASEIDVKLVSNYTMELEEPGKGRLTYDARIGYISQ
jgi:hypothetical protein